MVRVTQEGMVQNALLRVQERLGAMDRAGRRLSSGKSLELASQDVSGMNRALSLRSRIRAREQEARNGADGLTWLNIADSKLQTANERLRRVRELTVRAGSAIDATAREAIAREIETIRDDLVAVANTNVDGRPLFGGTSNAAAVVTGPPWAYTGDTQAIQRRIGDAELVTINANGEELFGFDPLDPSANLFAKLDTLVTDIRAGNSTAVSATLSDLDAAMQRTNKGLATIGAATNRIDTAMVRNQDEQMALKGELAKVEDVDLAEAIMNLQTQEVAYQATLGALSRVLQPSLMDFLR